MRVHVTPKGELVYIFGGVAYPVCIKIHSVYEIYFETKQKI
jgi:hypothetical protein